MLDVMTTLADLADQHGMTVKQVSRFDDLLATVGLTKADLTADVVAATTANHRDAVDKLFNKVRRFNRDRGHTVTPTEVAVDKAAGRLADADLDAALKAAKPKRKQGKVVRGTIMGYSATSVLRALGAAGVNFEDAGVILASYHLGAMADITIKIQLKAGKDRDPKRGPAAPLTPAQLKELIKLAD
jgi:hypothetical protein